MWPHTVACGTWILLFYSLTVHAQCGGPNITIFANHDALQIANCLTYDGDITIDQSAEGEINLNGIQQVTGNLTCKNANGVTAIQANELTTIGGTFDLEDLNSLTTLTFDNLSAVNLIDWSSLPVLSNLYFPTSISRVSQVSIWQTDLRDLDGFNFPVASSLSVFANFNLRQITINSLINITDSINIGYNSKDLKVRLRNLQTAGNLTFEGLSFVDLPALVTVTGRFSVDESYNTDVSATALATVGSDLSVHNCQQVESLRFPSLTRVSGWLNIINNTKLSAVSGFPLLTDVGGTMQLSGTFDSVDLPNLTRVTGNATIATTSQDRTICDQVSATSAAGQTSTGKGFVERCSTGVSSDSPSSTVTPHRFSTGEIAGIAVAAIALGRVATAALVWRFFLRPRRRYQHDAQHGKVPPRDDTHELPRGDQCERPELVASTTHAAELQSHGEPGPRGPDEDPIGRVREINPQRPAELGDRMRHELDSRKHSRQRVSE